MTEKSCTRVTCLSAHRLISPCWTLQNQFHCVNICTYFLSTNTYTYTILLSSCCSLCKHLFNQTRMYTSIFLSFRSFSHDCYTLPRRHSMYKRPIDLLKERQLLNNNTFDCYKRTWRECVLFIVTIFTFILWYKQWKVCTTILSYLHY